MSQDKLQDEFNRWFESSGWTTSIAKAAALEAWQASRAAVVVRIDLEEWPASMANEIQQAIEATGLRVAP